MEYGNGIAQNVKGCDELAGEKPEPRSILLAKFLVV